MVLRIVIKIELYIDNRLEYQGSGVCRIENLEFNGRDMTWEATLFMCFYRGGGFVSLQTVRVSTSGTDLTARGRGRYLDAWGYVETYSPFTFTTRPRRITDEGEADDESISSDRSM
jgi:hypothetical protein